MNYQEQINILIAETLEKVQHLNPELYGQWYSQLYAPYGDGEHNITGVFFYAFMSK
jgi:hypothetical protein